MSFLKAINLKQRGKDMERQELQITHERKTISITKGDCEILKLQCRTKAGTDLLASMLGLETLKLELK